MTAPDFEIDNREIRDLLNSIARRIGYEMPKGWGFALFLFSYGEPSQPTNLFYISSAQREQVIAALTEFITKGAS